MPVCVSVCVCVCVCGEQEVRAMGRFGEREGQKKVQHQLNNSKGFDLIRPFLAGTIF